MSSSLNLLRSRIKKRSRVGHDTKKGLSLGVGKPPVASGTTATAGNFTGNTWVYTAGLTASDIGSQHMATGCDDGNPDKTQKFWSHHRVANRNMWFLDASHDQDSGGNQGDIHTGLRANHGGVSKMHFSINVDKSYYSMSPL